MTDPHTNHSNTNTSHTVRDTHVTEKKSGSSMAFIVGGLVVAVAVIAWLFMAGDDVDNVSTTGAVDTTTPAVDTTPAGDTNVTVEAPEANASSGAAAESDAPAAAADADAEAPVADVEAPAAEAEATTGN